MKKLAVIGLVLVALLVIGAGPVKDKIAKVPGEYILTIGLDGTVYVCEKKIITILPKNMHQLHFFHVTCKKIHS